MDNLKSSYGVSFSLHRCSELDVNKKHVLQEALDNLGFRRFRLMSYWNIHEQTPGVYDFSELDWQMDMVSRHSGEISLCIGKRQPRWPECHMPDWAVPLERDEWRRALYKYIEVVVQRYRHHPALASWQLENEALLRDFGNCKDNDYDRVRLNNELQLVKNLDPSHPVIMTLSDSYGIPTRKPRPDIYAMSLYRSTINKRGKRTQSIRPAIFYKSRAKTIQLLYRSRPFIHEFQAEPWLDRAISEVPVKKQLELMNPDIFNRNIDYANKTGMSPVDLWGLEWWYWLKVRGHPEMWQAVKYLLRDSLVH